MKCSDLCCVQDVQLHPFYYITSTLGTVRISCPEILLCQVELLLRLCTDDFTYGFDREDLYIQVGQICMTLTLT